MLFSKRTGFDPRVEVLFVVHLTNLPWFKQATINIGEKSLEILQKIAENVFQGNTFGAVTAGHKVRGLALPLLWVIAYSPEIWREKARGPRRRLRRASPLKSSKYLLL